MKLLGLDVGDRRVGIAFGDTDLRLATPVDVITRATPEQDARALAVFAQKYDIAQLVVGLPRNMDGTQGAQANAVVVYAEKIARALDLPLLFWDERLTTIEAAQRMLPQAGRKKKARRALDAIAAALILQDFMDSQSVPKFPLTSASSSLDGNSGELGT
jgi:putative Holliday junction resolvase